MPSAKSYLFVHHDGPGQYVHVIAWLAKSRRGRVVLLTARDDVRIDGVEVVPYRHVPSRGLVCHRSAIELNRAIEHGAAVADACRQLRDRRGLHPHVVVGHGGWGEMLFVKDVFPDCPVLSYFEFYYHARGVDTDFDPEFRSSFIDTQSLRTRNAITLMTAQASDGGHTATKWQRSLLPRGIAARVRVLHEGVDTAVFRPRADAVLRLAGSGLELRKGNEVLTYCARNLEPYRGFHSFMRSLPEILKQRPDSTVLIVGGDEPGYGPMPPPGKTFRQVMLDELDGRLDLQRVHFLGTLDHADYLRVLQVSAVHVYLTCPFILSWSCLEAMATGCVVVGSATPPVQEVIVDGDTGVLVDFLSPDEIAAAVIECLRDREAAASTVGARARRMVQNRYGLDQKILPRWLSLLDGLSERH